MRLAGSKAYSDSASIRKRTIVESALDCGVISPDTPLPFRRLSMKRRNIVGTALDSDRSHKVEKRSCISIAISFANAKA
ncbi:hypothetical protein M0802_013031 [Mischocyttarus mexicanus]|nr:hypothetical protein M0802_013031 [Mischocyttarus mexicanus]